MKKEIQKEVDEEFEKYLKEEAKNKKKKFEIDWYKILAVLIMAVGLISTLCFLIPLFMR